MTETSRPPSVGARCDAGLTIDQIEDEMASLPLVEPGAFDHHCERRAELARRRGEIVSERMKAASAPKPSVTYTEVGGHLIPDNLDPAVKALFQHLLLSTKREAHQ
jgi:hypothetical protein